MLDFKTIVQPSCQHDFVHSCCCCGEGQTKLKTVTCQVSINVFYVHFSLFILEKSLSMSDVANI